MVLPMTPTWLPPHTSRFSNRAKRISIRICPHYGLEIVMPIGITDAAVCAFLEKHRHWIEKNYRRVKPLIRAVREPEIPEQIYFSAVQVSWQVYPVGSDLKKIMLHDITPQQLLLTGNLCNKKHVRQAMHVWLKKQAQQHLVPWLKRVSEKVQLPYAETKIGNAQSLWGSCSIEKNISLSARLLFLSEELVEYVMLHELCHTIHFNHSKQFWALLEQFSPHYLACKKALRHANRHVPVWALDN